MGLSELRVNKVWDVGIAKYGFKNQGMGISQSTGPRNVEQSLLECICVEVPCLKGLDLQLQPRDEAARRA